MQRRRNTGYAQSGFTLIELLVVMVIIGLLVALVGPNVMGRAEKAKPQAARVQIENLASALEMFKLDVGRNGIFSFITDQEHFLALIRAVHARSKVNILATPHVIAADNREAHILIGEEVPILTSTQQSTLATANIVSSIQYRDTGTILTILPQVNSAGLVNMEIRQEVSNVGVTSFGDTNSPSFTSRETETTVVVRNRESVLIGGIIDERVERSRSGIPFLMDVPVLGRLFRVEQDKRERTELVILITPYVIRDRNEAQAVTQEFTRRVNRLRNMIERTRQAWPDSSAAPSGAGEK